MDKIIKANHFRANKTFFKICVNLARGLRGFGPCLAGPGFAFFGREPYSYIQRTEQRYQFTDNFSWTIGQHATKFGAHFNYIPLKAIFTVN